MKRSGYIKRTKPMKRSGKPLARSNPPFPKGLYAGGCPRRPGDTNYVGTVKPTAAALRAFRKWEKAKEAKQKPRKPMPKMSPQRTKENALYEKAVKEWQSKHDGQCEVRVLGDKFKHTLLPFLPIDQQDGFRCRNRANSRPHHRAKRAGKLLYDKRFFMGCCQEPHHSYIHAHENEARDLGYLVTPESIKP